MILQELVIENLFCYHGRHALDLRPDLEAGRPIVVIRGRNGQGKTSLLTSLLLLFGGVSEHVRRAATARVMPGQKQYVWGDPGLHWEGILNRQAREQGVGPFKVSATLVHEGSTFRVSRSWEAQPRGTAAYEGQLEVTRDDRPVEDPKRALEDLIPLSFLPYYLFDGELIQSLEVLRGGSIDEAVNQLLEIGLIEGLAQRVGGWSSAWASEAADADTRRALNEVEAELTRNELEQQLAKEERSRQEDAREGLKLRRKDLRARLDSLPRDPETDRNTLQKEVKGVAKKIEKLEGDIYTRWLPLAPLSLNPELGERLLAQLDAEEEARRRPAQAQAELARALAQHLPHAVLRTPPWPEPPLTEAQVAFLERRLTKALQAHVDEPEVATPQGTWAGLSLAGARALRDQCLLLSREGNARAFGECLAELAEQRSHHARLQERLEDLADLPGALRQEARRLRAEIESLSEQIGKLDAELDPRDGRLHRTLLELGQQRTKIIVRRKALLDEVARKQEAGARARVARGAEGFLEAFKTLARERRRAQVSADLYGNFTELMSSSRQVGRLEFDAGFQLAVYDPTGRRIPPGSLSAGMKQLVAVAFLWALQKATGRELPVAIDTPLARLDKAHQEAVLFDYLPRAARQVLLLPTDAELDEARLQRLAPHVARFYELVNTRGDETRIVDKGRA